MSKPMRDPIDMLLYGAAWLIAGGILLWLGWLFFSVIFGGSAVCPQYQCQ